MSRYVPYLTEEAIERDAEALLAEFVRARGVVLRPPIPIEDIVEKHLKLGVEFDDTHDLFGIPRRNVEGGQGPDILGAIFFDQRRIVIDESLDPEENQSLEGRYRFTLAHEGGGHWQLHRHLYAVDEMQASLFEDVSVPSVVCRSSEARERVEWQADFYASCLLMPREHVYAVWRERFPGHDKLVMDRSERDAIAKIKDPVERKFEGNAEEWRTEMEMETIARPLAELFQVSPIAMRIRLERLGLLLSEAPRQRQLVELV